MDPPTIRFRLALPYALFPASPPLAALHASRARALHAEHIPLDSPPCSRCGSLLVHQPRSFKNKKQKKVLRRSCLICEAVTDTLLPPTTFPPTRSHNILLQHSPQIEPEPSPTPPRSIAPTPLTTAAKSRPKKKSGLQHLLARNCENEDRERQKQKNKNSQLGGLAAFLSDLS